MMKVLVSACLLGENCKYNGGNNYCPEVIAFLEGKEAIPVCPEVEAGMGCPRVPVEIVDGVLKDQEGNLYHEQMCHTIEGILSRLCPEDIDCAILKSRSPTCGVHQVYDGSFSGRLIDGSGVLAQALADAGYRVIDAEDLPLIF